MPLITINRGLSRHDRNELVLIRKALERIGDVLESARAKGSQGASIVSFYKDPPRAKADDKPGGAMVVDTDDAYLAMLELAEMHGDDSVAELQRRRDAGELEGFYEELERRVYGLDEESR